MMDKKKASKGTGEKETSSTGEYNGESVEENESKNAEEVKESEEIKGHVKDEEKDKTIEDIKSSDTETTDETVDFSDFLPNNMEQVLKLSLFQIQPWAYIYLGLNLHPKENKVVKDVRQAKMAVDAASALVEVLMPHVTDAEQKELKVLITDMRMNFISKSREG
ncbi:MAG: DUF1844 domain-containing protein [Candidatus Eremiobacteraeota bacterium]|nr:DUF1844 domain-containing protein [Candidatus Eremiobacteraeota bacterium]